MLYKCDPTQVKLKNYIVVTYSIKNKLALEIRLLTLVSLRRNANKKIFNHI